MLLSQPQVSPGSTPNNYNPRPTPSRPLPTTRQPYKAQDKLMSTPSQPKGKPIPLLIQTKFAGPLAYGVLDPRHWSLVLAPSHWSLLLSFGYVASSNVPGEGYVPRTIPHPTPPPTSVWRQPSCSNHFPIFKPSSSPK